MSNFRLNQTSSGFIHFLRAILSQIVMIGHVLILNGLYSYESALGGLPPYAVMVFFILSGFVISYSVNLKDKNYGFKNYLADRFARIFSVVIPTLLLTLILGLIGIAISGESPFSMNLWHFLSTLLMQQENLLFLKFQYYLPNEPQYNIIGFFGENLPLWSLSLEWWNYVFFGFVFYFTASKYKTTQYMLFLMACLFVITYALFPGRASSGLSFIWFGGVLIHYILNNGFQTKKSGWLAFVFLVFTAVQYEINQQLSIVFCALFFSASIMYFQEREFANWKRFFGLFKWPGNYSFTLYSIHYPILLFTLAIVKDPIINSIIVIVLSNLISFLFFHLFENRYKRFATLIKEKTK
jgi:peptidoglycan/LPS O-acetylase OafA/YrhL